MPFTRNPVGRAAFAKVLKKYYLWDLEKRLCQSILRVTKGKKKYLQSKENITFPFSFTVDIFSSLCLKVCFKLFHTDKWLVICFPTICTSIHRYEGLKTELFFFKGVFYKLVEIFISKYDLAIFHFLSVVQIISIYIFLYIYIYIFIYFLTA